MLYIRNFLPIKYSGGASVNLIATSASRAARFLTPFAT